MRVKWVTGLLLIWNLAGFGQSPASGRYVVETSQSQVRFAVKKWSVLDVEGVFARFRGEIEYDAAQPARSRVWVEVETASVTTGDNKRDESLADPQFFDSRRYPVMRFESVSISEGPQLLQVQGRLRIKDQTRPLAVAVRLLGVQRIPGEGSFATFETEFVVDRREFQVLGGSLSRTMIGNEVKVRLTLGAKLTSGSAERRGVRNKGRE